VEKARRMLGFEATTALDETLDEVVPWIEHAVQDGLV
jgi:UDP-glucose 4-epimerase